MPLPQRIQAELDAADAMLAQMNQPPADPQAPVEPLVPEPVAAVPPVQDTPPTPAPIPAPAVAEPTAPVPSPRPDDWEHRFKSLQGRYNRLAQDTTERMRTLEQHIQQLTQQRQEPSSPPEPVADTTKDAEVFGADMVDMVKRVAETLFGSVARKVDERLTAIERRLEGTTQQVAKTGDEVFVDRLRQLVPNYEAINVDEGFLNWLAEEDPVYGEPRQNALTKAADARDVERVARIFQAYVKTFAPAATPAQPAPTPASELDRQVAPRASASAPAAPTGKPTFRAAEVTHFYREVQAGRYRGREQEALAIEAQFNNALAEGRIVD